VLLKRLRVNSLQCALLIPAYLQAVGNKKSHKWLRQKYMYCIVSVVGKVRKPFFKTCIGVLVIFQKDLLKRAFEIFLCACGTGLETYSHYSRQAQL
jgi:hypothetical protein